jgi:lipid-binding SYLF domain-containing protein
MPENGIPQELSNEAEAVAVFPNVTKAAFEIGGRWGEGLISQRNNGQSYSRKAREELSFFSSEWMQL